MPLSPALRAVLAKPFGPVMSFGEARERLSGPGPRPLLVAVGDQTIFNLLQADLVPDIGIFDLQCQRKPLEMKMREYILTAASLSAPPARARNPAGSVTAPLQAAVKAALGARSGWVHIDGEDDLAGLVVMAQAPAGSVLLYGQPNQGVVWVGIDAKKRKEARALLEKISREE